MIPHLTDMVSACKGVVEHRGKLWGDLTEALRTDMIGRPIGVSVYCPGPVKSNIGEG